MSDLKAERNKPFDIPPDPMTFHQLKTWFEEWYGVGTFPVNVPSDEEIEKMAKETYDDLIFVGVSNNEAQSHRLSWANGCKFMRNRIVNGKTEGE